MQPLANGRLKAANPAAGRPVRAVPHLCSASAAPAAPQWRARRLHAGAADGISISSISIAAAAAAAAALAVPPPALAAAAAEAAAAAGAGQDLLQLGGVLGIAFGGGFAALWRLSAADAAAAQAAASGARAEVAARDEEIARLEAELEAERKARQEAESLAPRLSEASKNIMKLEKALEIKDGQLDVFLSTARRQIKALEDDIRALQQLPHS
ncbi:hypothetical protein Rsub_07755 [Raphidocelis subcapitata]|uniref:Uncharacterized protein n=1 Tax=Raphidocelis subcapitata TaxID=307507 RepID=A0A2V0PDT0_9CHLO|nr:hypothetical protein Rsub_07755 [Raphidocelis subcapitata]|eukprot:GBF95327.1 hypothetical protein Rsub_07755 [Raphidocelis subcapitata]